MRLALPLGLLCGLASFGLVACSSDDAATSSATTSTSSSSGSGGAGGGGDGGGGAGGGPLCTDPTAVVCEDQVILQMNLQSDITPGLIDNQDDAGAWLSAIDATAGGAFASDPDSYTYGKFTDAGLQKVDISDEDSITSMDWDIAFRRYVVRINSGHSGPSCVQAGRLGGSPVFDEVTAVPSDIVLHEDEYFTESCEVIPDGSGLPGSPATALGSYWSYPGCVAMTDHIFIAQLADARFVKLRVESYYTPEVQDECDTTGAVPMSNTGSGSIVLRWAYLP
jgi:hypothetical protein